MSCHEASTWLVFHAVLYLVRATSDSRDSTSLLPLTSVGLRMCQLLIWLRPAPRWIIRWYGLLVEDTATKTCKGQFAY